MLYPLSYEGPRTDSRRSAYDGTTPQSWAVGAHIYGEVEGKRFRPLGKVRACLSHSKNSSSTPTS